MAAGQEAMPPDMEEGDEETPAPPGVQHFEATSPPLPVRAGLLESKREAVDEEAHESASAVGEMKEWSPEFFAAASRAAALCTQAERAPPRPLPRLDADVWLRRSPQPGGFAEAPDGRPALPGQGAGNGGGGGGGGTGGGAGGNGSGSTAVSNGAGGLAGGASRVQPGSFAALAGSGRHTPHVSFDSVVGGLGSGSETGKALSELPTPRREFGKAPPAGFAASAGTNSAAAAGAAGVGAPATGPAAAVVAGAASGVGVVGLGASAVSGAPSSSRPMNASSGEARSAPSSAGKLSSEPASPPPSGDAHPVQRHASATRLSSNSNPSDDLSNPKLVKHPVWLSYVRSAKMEERFLKKRLGPERKRLLPFGLAMVVVLLMALGGELATDPDSRSSSDASVIARRVVTLALVAFFIAGQGLVSDFRAHYRLWQLLTTIVLAMIGMSLSIHQFFVQSREENLLGLVPVLMFLPLALMLCNLPMPHSLAYSGLMVVTYLVGLVFSSSEADEALGTWVVLLQATVVTFMWALMLSSRWVSESRERSTFEVEMKLRERQHQMQKETRELRSEYFDLMLEKFDVADRQDRFDFDSPMAKALRVLQQLKQNPNISVQELKSLSDVIAALSDHRFLYMPSLSEQIDQNHQLDLQTVMWLRQQQVVPLSGPPDTPSSRRGHDRHDERQARSSGSDAPAHHRKNSLSLTQSELTSVFDADETQIRELLMRLDEWNFDIFALADLTHQRPLFAVGVLLFQRYNLHNKFKIDEQKLVCFLAEIESGYLAENQYHNSMHAADVAVSAHYLLNAGAPDERWVTRLSDTELLVLVISALVHDFKHPGVANGFLTATKHPLAITYNDISVLEMHHASAAFTVLGRSDCNILENLSPEEYKQVRKGIIDVVLATDLASHMPLLGRLQARLAVKPMTHESPEDRLDVVKMAVKSADIGHTAKRHDLHQKWTQRVTEEFFQEGDMERDRGMPVSAFKNRHNADIPSSQLSFIDFMVQPWFECFSQVVCFRDMRTVVMRQLAENRNYWKSLKLANDAAKDALAPAPLAGPLPAAALAAPSASVPQPMPAAPLSGASGGSSALHAPGAATLSAHGAPPRLTVPASAARNEDGTDSPIRTSSEEA